MGLFQTIPISAIRTAEAGLNPRSRRQFRTLLAVAVSNLSTLGELLECSSDAVLEQLKKQLDQTLVAKISALDPCLVANVLGISLVVTMTETDFNRAVENCFDKNLSSDDLFKVCEAVYYRGLYKKTCVRLIPTKILNRLESIDSVLAIKTLVNWRAPPSRVVTRILEHLQHRGTRRQVAFGILEQFQLYVDMPSLLASAGNCGELVQRLRIELARTRNKARKHCLSRLLVEIEAEQ